MIFNKYQILLRKLILKFMFYFFNERRIIWIIFVYINTSAKWSVALAHVDSTWIKRGQWMISKHVN
jgi:hypothetical protein